MGQNKQFYLLYFLNSLSKHTPLQSIVFLSFFLVLSLQAFSSPPQNMGAALLHSFPSKIDSSHPAVSSGIHYTVRFEGTSDARLLGLFHEASQLIALQNKPAHSLEALRQRIFDDIPHLMKVLESQGYYDGQVIPFLKGGPYTNFSGKFQIILQIIPGSEYLLESFDMKMDPFISNLEPLLKDTKDLGLELHHPARAQDVSNILTKLVSKFSTKGYPLAKIKSQSILIQENTHTMAVKIVIDPGRLCRFGPISIEGLKHLDSSYILAEIPWKNNDLFDSLKIDKLRSSLLQSNLFSSVEIIPEKTPKENGDLPIVIRVVENKRYYIGTGAYYSSSEGAGIKAFWGNRNLFGKGEKLEITGQSGKITSGAETVYTKPHFLRPDQTLTTSLAADSFRPDAYYKKGVSSLINLTRKFNERWSGSLGGEYSLSKIKQDNMTHTYHLPSIPFGIKYSTVDSLLDPTHGFKAHWSLVPFPKILGGQSNFARISLKQLFHEPLLSNDGLIFSSYLNVGLMPNGNRNSVPPDRLFYAGGAGSVRGYGYQLAGPLDAHNNPLGGSSAFETGAEILAKVAKDIGIVSFVDAGTVYNNPVPNFSGSLFWGVGTGIRYYTAIGPLRFDIAFPLKRRSGVDSAFQIYAGIGQSF